MSESSREYTRSQGDPKRAGDVRLFSKADVQPGEQCLLSDEAKPVSAARSPNNSLSSRMLLILPSSSASHLLSFLWLVRKRRGYFTTLRVLEPSSHVG